MRPDYGDEARLLLAWTCVYVVLLMGAAAYIGKLGEALPILTHLVTGISGAALALLRVAAGERAKAGKEDTHDGRP